LHTCETWETCYPCTRRSFTTDFQGETPSVATVGVRSASDRSDAHGGSVHSSLGSGAYFIFIVLAFPVGNYIPLLNLPFCVRFAGVGDCPWSLKVVRHFLIGEP